MSSGKFDWLISSLTPESRQFFFLRICLNLKKKLRYKFPFRSSLYSGDHSGKKTQSLSKVENYFLEMSVGEPFRPEVPRGQSTQRPRRPARLGNGCGSFGHPHDLFRSSKILKKFSYFLLGLSSMLSLPPTLPSLSSTHSPGIFSNINVLTADIEGELRKTIDLSRKVQQVTNCLGGRNRQIKAFYPDT